MAPITGVLTEGPEGSPAFLLLPEPILGGSQAPRLPELLVWGGRAFGEQPSPAPTASPRAPLRTAASAGCDAAELCGV